MYCKKCGTEQRDGQKFCPKCGTPYLKMEQYDEEVSSKEIQVRQEPQEQQELLEDPVLNQQQQEQESVSEDVTPLNLREEKIIRLYAKAGMWIIIAAIVLTFVRAGFGFSIWWYLYLILFAGVAFLLWGTNSSDTDSNHKGLNRSEATIIKGLSYIGAAMLVVLYLWGPLNANYSSGSSHFSNSDFGSSPLDSREDSTDDDLEIEVKMSNIRAEIQSILPKVEALYSIHQQHMAKGFPYASSPAWGKWQDCNTRIDDLWNEYIRLAQQLSGNNDDVIEEARESKRKMDKAFKDMFGAHY